MNNINEEARKYYRKFGAFKEFMDDDEETIGYLYAQDDIAALKEFVERMIKQNETIQK